MARMRQVLKLQRPDRLPCSDWRMVEYRKDVYHLGDMEFIPAAGEVGVSADGTRRFTRDGGVWAVNAGAKYRDHNDVLNVNLDQFEVEGVGERMLGEMARFVEEAARTHFPVPHHYGTLITRATIEFGWEPFLTAWALEPERFRRILDCFGAASLAVATGWAQTDGVELVTIHDDLAATRGPLVSPDWYRADVFPWYRRIFAAVHERGKKVLFVCDGNYAPLLDDLLAAGADGLYIESSSMDPEPFMRQAGSDKLFLIKTDSRNIDFGAPEEIRRELAKLRDLHQEFPGMMVYRGGGNPQPGNAEAFERHYWQLLVHD
jgi:hypothetical protein